jgi:3-hydroxyacyl-CoA dehydrogenase
MSRSVENYTEDISLCMLKIEKAAVLGAGTMGAGLAAHLANAGMPVLLLDIAPRDLTPEEVKKNFTLDAPEVRNRIARAGLEAAKRANPAAFFTPDTARLVQIGNFTDDLAKIKDCDFIIEAVVENLEIKRRVYAEVEKHRRADSIVATNTSGIPVRAIAENFTENFRQYFLGTHFFNPPRYLHLCELIATEWTLPEVACSVHGFLDRRLGKGVVVAKDRPNFIANRIGTFGAMATVRAMLDDGYTIEEVDRMTGQAVGRPKSATFRTFDLVGLDVLTHVAANLYEAVPEDEERETYVAPEFLKNLIERGILGNKTGGGFYRRQKGETGEKEIWTLDTASFEYRPSQKPKLPALDTAKTIENTPERIKTLIYGKDRAGEFLWKTTSRTLLYAANRIPEIADTIVDVDRAMRWGFAWELGVFETWDAIGLEKSIARMREEGREIPEKIERMLESGAKSFYKIESGQELFFDFATNAYKPVVQPAGTIILKSEKERSKTIKKNSGASLIDIGDGVACLEFHTKMNAVGADIVSMINTAVAETEKTFVGLVIGNQGGNFSAGANIMQLLLAAQEEEWDEIDLGIRAFQRATMRLRYSRKPVVVAPFGLTLGGGCEITLHADRVRASAETYIGLVEVGVGLIPAGGGSKEMLVRAMDAIPKTATDVDAFPFVKNIFETIALARVATSAEEARQIGFLGEEDTVSMNPDRLIADAKQEVLALATVGYTQPQERTDVLALGMPALATLKLGIHQMKRGGYISEHDALIGEKLARILTGGDLNHPTQVSEQYLLDLEREAFLSLCGERKTQERIAHMLKTGKPLRN